MAAPRQRPLAKLSTTGGGLPHAGVRLDGADLSAADLRGVVGLTHRQLDAAVCDRHTKLPDGFRDRGLDVG